MESPVNEENIRNLPYSELKKIAKLRGIKCNMKAEKIVNALLAGNMGSEEDSFLSLEQQIINSSKKNKLDKFDKDKKESVSETPRRETYIIEDQDVMLNIDAIIKSASPDLDCSNVTMTRGSERKLRNRKVSFVTPMKTSRTSISTPKYLSLKDRPKTPIATRYSEAKRVSFITPNKKQSLTKKSLPSTPHPMHPKKKTRLSEVGASSSKHQGTPIVHIPTPIPKSNRGRTSRKGTSTPMPNHALKENSILESEMKTSEGDCISTPQSKFTPKLTIDSIKKTPLVKRKSSPFPNRAVKENSEFVSAEKMSEKEISEEESFSTPLSKFTPKSSFDSNRKTTMNQRKSTPMPNCALQESSKLESSKKLHKKRKSTPMPNRAFRRSTKLDSVKKLSEESSSTPLSKNMPRSSISSIRKMAFEQNERLISAKKPTAIVGSGKKTSVVATREIATAEKSVHLKSCKKEGSVETSGVVADENKPVSKGVKQNRSGTPSVVADENKPVSKGVKRNRSGTPILTSNKSNDSAVSSKRKNITTLIHTSNQNNDSALSSKKKNIATPIHTSNQNNDSALSSKKKNIATPNFKAIHQRAFDKLESIDEYLKRKTELSAKRTRNDISVQNRPQLSSVKKVVATKLHNPKTFTGIPFIPSVTHTQNLKLGSGVAPRYLQAAVKRNLKPAAESKNVRNIRFVAGSKIASVSMENKPVRRSAFDLRASLSKKLPYKPHTGPLKPLTEANLNSTVNSTLHIHKATEEQNPSVQVSRAKCRNMLHGVRTNRRFELQMSKRINEK